MEAQMRKKLLLTIVAAVFLLSVALGGCQAGGIPQEAYDEIVAKLTEANDKIAEAREYMDTVGGDMETLIDQLQESRDEADTLRQQVADLKLKYEFTGATPAETAERINEYYHETHVYEEYDLFVCSDMAAEVWNMLKAQGINALMAIGSPDSPPLADISQCGHAWVLAEIAPGEYLALETTGGVSVSRQSNGGYYRGWTFQAPADIKLYHKLVQEYNVRVVLRNDLAHEADDALNQYNLLNPSAEADEYLAIYHKMKELRDAQEELLISIRATYESLATKLG
jgi:hypothetical protein